MNIVDFLIQDHDNLRRQIACIHRSICCADLSQRVKRFISSYEMHESIEEEILFPEFDLTLEKRACAIPAPDHEEMHAAMWGYMDNLITHLHQIHHVGFQQAFFEFAALAERHFETEERALFPVVREVLDEARLRELGGLAMQKLRRFPNGFAAAAKAS